MPPDPSRTVVPLLLIRQGRFGIRSVLAVVALIAVATACAMNPYTDRPQLLMIPQGYANQLGAQAYQQVLDDPKNRISHDPQEVDPVKRVAERIIAAAKDSRYAETAKSFEWEVSVIKDDKTQNAFALPGGKIAVYTGIFPMAHDEAGLAAIVGHEVTHALARHGTERMSQGLVAQVTLTGAALALGAEGTSPAAARAIMAALGVGAQVGVLLPFSRKHESEADHIGMLLMAMAGYDPHEAVHVWERMSAAGGGQPPEFLSTHPSHGTRIQQLNEWMPEALDYYQKAPKAEVHLLPPIKGKTSP